MQYLYVSFPLDKYMYLHARNNNYLISFTWFRACTFVHISYYELLSFGQDVARNKMQLHAKEHCPLCQLPFMYLHAPKVITEGASSIDKFYVIALISIITIELEKYIFACKIKQYLLCQLSFGNIRNLHAILSQLSSQKIRHVHIRLCQRSFGNIFHLHARVCQLIFEKILCI